MPPHVEQRAKNGQLGKERGLSWGSNDPKEGEGRRAWSLALGRGAGGEKGEGRRAWLCALGRGVGGEEERGGKGLVTRVGNGVLAAGKNLDWNQLRLDSDVALLTFTKSGA